MPERFSVRIADWGGEPLARPGDDPDSFVRREGPDAFRRFIANAKPAGDWIITQQERALSPTADAMERSEVVRKLMDVVTREGDPILRAHYRRRLADIGQVEPTVIALMAGERPVAIYERPEYEGVEF